MSDRPIVPWTVEHTRKVADRRIFSVQLVRARSRLRPHQVGEFVVLDVPDWVNVIALTPEREVVLVEQYRHGTRAITLEIPGGMVDPGETMHAAGLRELLEETGFAGDAAHHIGTVEPNPAFQDNRCGTLLVQGAQPIAAQDLDPNEEIRVRTVPLTDIPDLIRSGAITHALVVAAFHHLTLWAGPTAPPTADAP